MVSPKIDDAMFVQLSEGPEALSRYVAETVHVDVNLRPLVMYIRLPHITQFKNSNQMG